MTSRQMEYASPTVGKNVVVGMGSHFGIQPLTTPANRREVDREPSGYIGDACVIGCNVVMYANVRLGVECRVGDFACIREGVRIGDRCVIGTNVDVQYGALIGDDVRILNGTHISGGTIIGNGTFVGPGVMTANHRNVDLHNYGNPPEGRHAPEIGRFVMIGVGAILLPGVKIGDGATIAAGALVTKDVPAGETWSGIPARRVMVFGHCHGCVTRSACRDAGACKEPPAEGR